MEAARVEAERLAKEQAEAEAEAARIEEERLAKDKAEAEAAKKAEVRKTSLLNYISIAS